MMKLIACVDDNWGIGNDNKLLCRIPRDMKRFREVTINKIVIMGRKTYESIGGPLPNRKNIVLSTDKSFKPKGVRVYNSVEDIITDQKLMKKANRIFIIGGSSIYEQFLPYCDTAYITKVHKSYEAVDSYMTNLEADKNWRVRTACVNMEYKKENLLYDFLELKRIQL